MKCINRRCVCEPGYSLSSSGRYCTQDNEGLWPYILIPFFIIMAALAKLSYCNKMKRKNTVHEVLSNNTVDRESNGQLQQHEDLPPPYLSLGPAVINNNIVHGEPNSKPQQDENLPPPYSECIALKN